jgi:hypothetical protein
MINRIKFRVKIALGYFPICTFWVESLREGLVKYISEFHMLKCRFFIFIDLRLMKWYLSPEQSFSYLIFVYSTVIILTKPLRRSYYAQDKSLNGIDPIPFVDICCCACLLKRKTKFFCLKVLFLLIVIDNEGVVEAEMASVACTLYSEC